ncbi:uncharacterized protein LOC127286523 [Leptopilina boulardi]|uniref:uncharacterized protein LOC127286523 n=1 Tax=Leptopilina boulardi TaxID=63433 RepID=UPI0021F658FA|nr:uncharacterized protein LOC127286523 [Leptopilina boulardi]
MNVQEQKNFFQDELRRLEDQMTLVLTQMDDLDKAEPAHEEVTGTETMEEDPVICGEDDDQVEETTRYLGINPSKSSDDLKLNEDVAARIKAWLVRGFATKEEKEKLLSSVSKKGTINLEAPILNEEVLVDIFPKSLTRDNYFKEYQNLTGAALSNIATIFDSIVHDQEDPPERDTILDKLSCSVKLLSHLFFSLSSARKAFLLGKYDERIQKILKSTDPTTYLFGDNLKGVIDSSKAMEKVSKDLKPKVNQTARKNNFLNWKSPSVKKEVNRGGGRSYPRPGTSKTSQYPYRPRPYPAKSHYHQSQPQQSRR